MQLCISLFQKHRFDLRRYHCIILEILKADVFEDGVSVTFAFKVILFILTSEKLS